MKIIGRREEIYELERCEKSNKSELVCVYGRRRVGKTYLVEQTFSDYFAFRKTSGNPRFFKCRDESDLIFINTMQESDEIYELLFVFFLLFYFLCGILYV